MIIFASLLLLLLLLLLLRCENGNVFMRAGEMGFIFYRITHLSPHADS